MSTMIQRSFAGGEIAPALYPRADTVKYSTGARTLRNHLILRHGGAASRPGTTFVAEVKDSTKNVKIIKFVVSDTVAYTLEFGDLYMRVHQNGVPVVASTKTIASISQANPAVLTISTDPIGFGNGSEVAISGVKGMTQVNGRNFKVVRLTSTTYQLQYKDGTNVNSTGWGAYTSGGSVSDIYELATPYAYTDVARLKFAQNADGMSLTHSSYSPRQLVSIAANSWTLGAYTFSPAQVAPTALTITNVGSGQPVPSTISVSYGVTAVSSTGEESLISNTPSAGHYQSSASSPLLLSWTAASGASSYNVYVSFGNNYGFIGTVVGQTTFSDQGYSPDYTQGPPLARNPFPTGTFANYPGCVAYFQQRLCFGAGSLAPETVWTSRTGNFVNFSVSQTSQSDDAITFRMAGRTLNEIRHLVDLGKLIILTSSGEWAIQGDTSGTLTPTSINPKQYSYYGASHVNPVVVGQNLIYVQARGCVIRELQYNVMIDGYKGNDLTIFSTHLFEGYTITDMAYQQVLNSIVWAVRSDGVLLGLTYLPEQEVLAWHRHDFAGTVENVCSVPEGQEDVVYLVVKRTIGGATKRYIERLSTRYVNDIVNFIGMDVAFTVDGRNTSACTMTLSGGTTWSEQEILTLTSSFALTFAATDVGNAIFLTGSDGSLIRFTIRGYTSGTVVTGTANKIVPASLQSTATATWSKAIQTVTGLWAIEGQKVSVLGDGFVVGSPNNKAYPVYTVTNGQITLDQPYAVIHVGLPYLCDIESLDLESVQGESMINKMKNVGQVTLQVEKSRGIWAGVAPPTNDSVDPLEGLEELKVRSYESMDLPVSLATRHVEINLQSQWSANGRVFLRQVDPLPMTILAIAQAGSIPRIT